MTGSRCGSATQRLSFPQRRKFPARAGVSPSLRCCLGGCVALPRASGGVSTVDTLGVCAACPSPRERGCLPIGATVSIDGNPFPARAGCFLVAARGGELVGPSPRERGVSPKCDFEPSDC